MMSKSVYESYISGAVFDSEVSKLVPYGFNAQRHKELTKQYNEDFE
jgi:hypothetical protein